MRRILACLLSLLILGCDPSPPPKSKPIPPDDLSNGPWKNRDKNKSEPGE